LAELKKLKPKLPEEECYVPEWDRKVTLRGFTVGEGRKIRQQLSKREDAEASETDMLMMIAHSIVHEDVRPLANSEGVALLEQLSELTVRRLAQTYMKVSTGEDVEGNSEPRVVSGNSSTDLPSPSVDGRSLN
jgi:hypothetical protein